MRSRLFQSLRPSPAVVVRAAGAAVVASALAGPGPALADVQPVTQIGVPILPVPVFPETGLPHFVMPVGTPSVPPPSTGTGTGTGGTGPTGGTSADEVLASRSWGAAAADNAETVGVTSTAVAATCVLESGCENIGGPGTVSGAFQMTSATYTADINQALAQNPALAGTIDTTLAGKMDPANEAIAAAQDLKDAALALQEHGISNPTVLDARAYYQWGSGPGPEVAASSNDENLSKLLAPYYTPAQMAANGVTPLTTVGQWRQVIITKVGSAANQQILI